MGLGLATCSYLLHKLIAQPRIDEFLGLYNPHDLRRFASFCCGDNILACFLSVTSLFMQ